MNIKKKAFSLHGEGLSYRQIANKLGISKTCAFEYVKEVRLSLGSSVRNSVPTNSEPEKEQRSEQDFKEIKKPVSFIKSPTANQSVVETVSVLKRPLKEFTGDELIEKKFESLEFTGKFYDLIGKPSKHFSGIIWGLPKGGKSNFSIRFADYLQEYFGKVVYFAAEEGESVTLQEKFKQIGGSKVVVVESRNKDDIREYLKGSEADFIFIDSINNAGINNDFLESLKVENPQKSFIAIVQATKGGNFKGDQALTHNCDFIIKVVSGVAYHSGRFGEASEIKIFEEPLYVKNIDEAQKVEIKKSKSPTLRAFDWKDLPAIPPKSSVKNLAHFEDIIKSLDSVLKAQMDSSNTIIVNNLGKVESPKNENGETFAFICLSVLLGI